MSMPIFTREIPALANTMSASSLKTTVRNKRHRAYLHGLLPQDTYDLVDIWRGSPTIFRSLDRYMKGKDRISCAFKHLFTMDFEREPSDFFQLLPPILLILVGGAVGSYLDALHSFFAVFLASGCFFAVYCMFAFAGHSVLHLGLAMDSENVSQTRVDTDILGTLAFQGMLVSESLGQLVVSFLLGGYLGFYASLIITLVMLGTATMMNHVKGGFTIYDERILQTAARGEQKNSMNEKDRKNADLESRNEGLQSQLHFQQRRYEREHQANDIWQETAVQKQQEVQRYATALTDARAGAAELSETNKLLQDTLADAYKSHDKALVAKEKYHAEEFAREKAHVEKLARQNMLAEFEEKVEANNNSMADRLAKASVALQQWCKGVLARKNKEYAEALANRDKEHGEALNKAKAEAQAAGSREAFTCCGRWLRSIKETAERRHAETLAEAISEMDKLHKEVLANKEKEFKEEVKKLEDSYAESQGRIVRFHSDYIQHKRNEHAGKIAEKDQELADMKAVMDRYPELFLAEDDVEDFEDEGDDADDEDEGYVSMVGSVDAESRNDGGTEPQDDEASGFQDDSETESQNDEDSEAQDDEDTDTEYEADDEDDESCKVEYHESKVGFNVDGDDSEDELRQWTVVDSDIEED